MQHHKRVDGCLSTNSLLGVVQNCQNFHERTQSCGEGVNGRIGPTQSFKKSTFLKFSFGRNGLTNNTTLCKLLIMLTILDDLLFPVLRFRHDYI